MEVEASQEFKKIKFTTLLVEMANTRDVERSLRF